MRLCVPMGLAALIVLTALIAGCVGAGQDSLGSYGTVRGTVSDATTGLPVTGASVTVASVTTTTDDTGGFAVINAPAGSKTYSVAADGYQSVLAMPIEIPRSRTTQLNVPLLPTSVAGGRVTGVVTSTETGEGLAGVTVAAETADTTTNSEGAYSLSGLTGGETTLTFTLTGYKTTTETVTVVEDAPVTLNTSLMPVNSGELTGTITDAATGQAIEGATVSIEGVGTATTDVSGAYQLQDVPAGTWDARFARTGYRTVDRTVGIEAGSTTVEDVALMSPSQGVVEGRVRSRSSGALVAGVNVTVVELGRSGETGSGVDSEGEGTELGLYQMLGIPSGTYQLHFTHPDYEPLTVAGVAVDAGATTVTDVEMEPAVGSVVGWVFEEDPATGLKGSPLSGASVRVGNEGNELTTAGDGHFAAHSLPADPAGTTYTVFAWDATHRLASVQVTVRPGQIVQSPDIVLERVQ